MCDRDCTHAQHEARRRDLAALVTHFGLQISRSGCAPELRPHACHWNGPKESRGERGQRRRAGGCGEDADAEHGRAAQQATPALQAAPGWIAFPGHAALPLGRAMKEHLQPNFYTVRRGQAATRGEDKSSTPRPRICTQLGATRRRSLQRTTVTRLGEATDNDEHHSSASCGGSGMGGTRREKEADETH